jgi:hypothetical protein
VTRPVVVVGGQWVVVGGQTLLRLDARGQQSPVTWPSHIWMREGVVVGCGGRQRKLAPVEAAGLWLW